MLSSLTSHFRRDQPSLQQPINSDNRDIQNYHSMDVDVLKDQKISFSSSSQSHTCSKKTAYKVAIVLGALSLFVGIGTLFYAASQPDGDHSYTLTKVGSAECLVGFLVTTVSCALLLPIK